MTARPEIDERLLDEALTWYRALEQDDADWDAYTRWLEADPLHGKAFDEIALTGRIVDDHIADLQALKAAPAADPAEIRTVSRRKWLYGSVAAALALAVGIPALRQQQDVVYATARGETRHIALSQGIAADLSPSTRLVVKGGDPTKLEVARGDVYFAVAHDPGRALSIRAGEYVVSDIGTTFGLNLSAKAVAVAVAEGHVSVAGEGGEATRVSAGQQLIARRDDRSTRIRPVPAANVGSWRQGRLVYDNMPLNLVAADIARYSGKTITVDPAIGDRPFSGVLAIGDGSELLANLSDLMAISYEEKGDSVRIGAAAVR
ncbi:MAG TPA: FecR domain-containing protein [Sphingomonadaceae bacterium]|nr:FecR domain-containing protein [Sphingomonadaceae bacterium]